MRMAAHWRLPEDESHHETESQAMFKRILAIVRGNDAEQRAVQRAALCAGRITELELLDVVHEPMLDGYMGNSAIYEPLRARVVGERNERVQELVAALRARDIEASGTAVWDHPLDEVIAKRLRTHHFDLVVIAPVEGPGGALSSSDWRVVTTCTVPVLVVKHPADANYRNIVAAVDPSHAHAKPAELDLAVLEQAHKFQTQTRAKLAVVHCYTPIENLAADLTVLAAHTPGCEARQRALAELMKKAAISASTVQVVSGAAHEVLKRMADRCEADLIVMGALARGRLKDWLIGSTAERVLHGGRADVLAVKPDQLR
jgi:universal stress protein E